jgi:hypothetical protein
VKHLHRFFSSDASGGIILIIAAILAMMMANSGNQWMVSRLSGDAGSAPGWFTRNQQKHAVMDK